MGRAFHGAARIKGTIIKTVATVATRAIVPRLHFHVAPLVPLVRAETIAPTMPIVTNIRIVTGSIGQDRRLDTLGT